MPRGAGTKDHLAVLRDMMEAGTLRTVIDRRFGLTEVPDAIAYLEQVRPRAA